MRYTKTTRLDNGSDAKDTNMTAQQVAQETIEYTIKHMVEKLQAAGYTQEQAAAYLTSDDGIKAALRLGEQFMRGAIAKN